MVIPPLEHVKPTSIAHTLAEHFHRDSVDFAQRFDLLWEAGPLMHKLGRIKSFIDLLMACECTLKAHGFLGRLNEDPREIYRAIRKRSHNIDQLADYASFNHDRADYDFLKSRLSTFSVVLRYSFDAYETFFPSLVDQSEAELSYSNTIGKNPWVMEIRAVLERLIEAASEKFTGFVSMDLDDIFFHESQMRAFVKECLK